MFSEAIFYSKLNYCLPVFGHVFGLDRYNDTSTRCSSFTKEDNRKMQVLQNSVMRLLTDKKRDTPTTDLLRMTNSLSIQQMVAFQTLIMVHKVIKSSKHAYLAAKLMVRVERDGRRVLERSQGRIAPANHTLGSSRGGFVYRGSKLFNSLPMHLRMEPNLRKYRESVRKWVLETIQARP